MRECGDLLRTNQTNESRKTLPQYIYRARFNIANEELLCHASRIGKEDRSSLSTLFKKVSRYFQHSSYPFRDSRLRLRLDLTEPNSFTSSQRIKMPVTELLFPLYKPESQSLEELKQKEQQIFQSFYGVEGLQAAFHGVVLEDNGVAVDPKTRGVLVLGKFPYSYCVNVVLIGGVLDWTNSSSFHAFYPTSPSYLSFGQTFKPFVAAPATPELYEAGGRSLSCVSSNFTQIIKVKSSKATEEAWRRLEESLGEFPIERPSFYHANGIEKDEGVFLGLIGWRSWQVRLCDDMGCVGLMQ